MEQKTKFILLGLAGVTIIFIFLYIQTLSSKQLVIREREDLKKENATLNSKVDKLQNTIRDNENKIGLLNKDLDIVSREKEELEKKFELVNKEKGELIERLKSKMAEAEARPKPEAQAQQQEPGGTDAYWAEVLKVKTDLGLQLGKLRNELKSTQITNEQLQREKATFELDINNMKRENGDLKRQLEYNQKVMDSITQELVREKNDKIKIQDAFKSIKNENTILTRQLKGLNKRKIDLETKLQEFLERNSALERKFSEIQTMLTDKLSQINDLKEKLDAIRSGNAQPQTPQEKKESVELPPIVVRPPAGVSPAESSAVTFAGKILAINRDTNFVIIDLGQDAGLKIGDTFQVYRDGNSIATIEVIQVRNNIAACDIKKETTPVKLGDIVR